MPRFSRRHKYLQKLKQLFKRRLSNRAIRVLSEDDDDNEIEDALDLLVANTLNKASSQRYLFRKSRYRKGRKERFTDDLEEEEEEADDAQKCDEEASRLPWLTDDEFLSKYRMSRDSFYRVHDLIKDHPVVFLSKKGKKKQAPVLYQLMVFFLKYIGTEGNGASNSNQRQTFGISYGSATNYRKRVTIAIRSFSKEYVYWPDKDERDQIGREINRLFNFPHCVGIADGTLFPLGFEPETIDAPDYSGRKYGYSLSTMIICDHKRRVRHYLAGYPGQAHDNRIFKDTLLARKSGEYFEPTEYLLGDSAFENQWFMVSAYKKLPGKDLERKEQLFNEKMSTLRVVSEHCIGMIKGRFPWLRQIRLVINEKKKSLKEILDLIDATIVLHNILVSFAEEEVDEWIDFDDFSDIDDPERAPYQDMDPLNVSIPMGAAKDERRRRLKDYFEMYFFL